MELKVRPCTFREACAFVDAHHRHHGRPQGCKFCLRLLEGDKIVGVVIAGRPIARHLDDGLTCEITRLCVDGTRNAASKLYGAARRVAGAMGYEKVITYTLLSESGSSLRAAGWGLEGETAGGVTWNRTSKQKAEPKRRWAAKAS